MTVTTTAHLNFRGDARAALEFYRSAFGGELTLVTYQDAHNVQDPSEAGQIMWGQVQGENGIHVMAYDVPARLHYEPGVNSYFISVRGTDTDEITTYWKALSDGADIVQDLAPAAWGPLYGMLRDRFGGTGSSTSSRSTTLRELARRTRELHGIPGPSVRRRTHRPILRRRGSPRPTA